MHAFRDTIPTVLTRPLKQVSFLTFLRPVVESRHFFPDEKSHVGLVYLMISVIVSYIDDEAIGQRANHFFCLYIIRRVWRLGCGHAVPCIVNISEVSYQCLLLRPLWISSGYKRRSKGSRSREFSREEVQGGCGLQL